MNFCLRYAVRGEMLERGAKLTEHIIIGTPGKVRIYYLCNNLKTLNVLNFFSSDIANNFSKSQQFLSKNPN